MRGLSGAREIRYSIVKHVQKDIIRWGFLLSLMALLFHIATQLELYQRKGMPLILLIQHYRTRPLDIVMKFFTFFGAELQFVLLPLLIWNGRKEIQLLGLNLLSQLQFTLLLVSVAKLIFLEERPYRSDESIRSSGEGKLEYSFPSGHAWAITVCWLFLATHFKKKWLSLVSVLIIFFTSFSRVYFGVHYPHDVIAGAGVGAMFFLFRKHFFMFDEDVTNFGKKVQERVPFITLNRRTGLQIMVTVAMFLVIVFVLDDEHKKQQMGLFFSLGSIAAQLMLSQRIEVYEDEGVGRLMMRLLIGICPFVVTLLSIYYVINRFAEFRDEVWLEPLLFLVGFVNSAWTIFFAPLVFHSLGLMSPVKPRRRSLEIDKEHPKSSETVVQKEE